MRGRGHELLGAGVWVELLHEALLPLGRPVTLPPERDRRPCVAPLAARTRALDGGRLLGKRRHRAPGGRDRGERRGLSRSGHQPRRSGAPADGSGQRGPPHGQLLGPAQVEPPPTSGAQHPLTHSLFREQLSAQKPLTQ